MPKARHQSMILTATTTTSPPAKTAREMPAVLPMLLIVLIAILVIATGVGYLQTSGGATNYACMSISHQGSSVQVKTTGLVHFLKQQYYVTCDEGSNLPTSTFTSSCLTITSQAVPSSIGFGARNELLLPLCARELHNSRRGPSTHEWNRDHHAFEHLAVGQLLDGPRTLRLF